MSTIELLRVSCATTDDACRIQLVGEADFSVLDELTRALEAVPLRRGQDVHLDVAGLEFVDLACMRALMRFAGRAERAGARVHVVHPNPSFTLVRRTMGLDVRQVCDNGAGR
jgi:anti-anti-sigma regulatory factor